MEVAVPAPVRQQSKPQGLPAPARPYLVVVLAAAAAIALPTLRDLDRAGNPWLLFAVLVVAASVAQLFVVRTGRSQSYHTAITILLIGAFTLPPALLVLLILAQHIPEWLKERYPWYIQSFNIANYTIDVFLARETIRLADRDASQAKVAAAALLACGVFTVTNHLVLAVMLRLARGLSFRTSGLFRYETLATDFILAALAPALVMLWQSNRWLVPAALAPLLLVHRSFAIARLLEEVRHDPKTDLYNARYFSAELRDALQRAESMGQPLSLIMADLDLLREINNAHGHLAGDVVLCGIADIFRETLREQDLPARFGGEEFAILLPDTPKEYALEVAERLRTEIAAYAFDVETCDEPIRATISLGVASYPADGRDANKLVHRADTAVYRAKVDGRNRVRAASLEPLPARSERRTSVVAATERDPGREHRVNLSQIAAADTTRRTTEPQARFLVLTRPLVTYLLLVGLGALGGGLAGLFLGPSADLGGLIALVLFVAGAQALALEWAGGGSITVAAVGLLAGVYLFGPRAALPLAVSVAAVEWSATRPPLRKLVADSGTLALASIAAGLVSSICWSSFRATPLLCFAFAVGGGAVFFVVRTALVSTAMALEGQASMLVVWRERCAWLAPHHLAFGAVAGAIAIAYDAAGIYAFAMFALPLLLMRKAMADYLEHTQRNTEKLRTAASTIQRQNESLEQANRLLRERSTQAMEGLSAAVDARDAYTAGHSRRVREIALGVGGELGLSESELETLGHAALFHDIGKIGLPDSILLKPSSLTEAEWRIIRRHSDEGARIIARLGFLDEAVSGIRHHHERFDGSGYPHGLAGEEIPLVARIIHVADALDSMLTTRTYRPARPLEVALEEIVAGRGRQFCPGCVDALLAHVGNSLRFRRERAERRAPATWQRPRRASAAR